MKYICKETIYTTRIIAQKINEDGSLGEPIEKDTALQLERVTGVPNSIISKSYKSDSDKKTGCTNDKGERYLIYKSSVLVEDIPYINLDAAKDSDEWNSDQRSEENKAKNLDILGIKVISKQDGNYICECLHCKKEIEKVFTYWNLKNNKYCLCEDCLRKVKAYHCKVSKQEGKTLFEVRPEILKEYEGVEYGGVFTYKKELNGGVDFKDIKKSSEMDMVLVCSNCDKKVVKKPKYLTRKKDMENGKHLECEHCKKKYNETCRTIKAQYPQLLDIIDFDKAKKKLNLDREDIETMIVTTKIKLPIFCCNCDESHYVDLTQLCRQNKDGIKLCNTCRQLIQVSYHHIYLVEYLLSIKHELYVEKLIEIDGKYLFVDIIDRTTKRSYEINGPQHYDKNNYFIRKFAQEKGITNSEAFEIVKKNDADKKRYLENDGYEYIEINIEEYTILEMLNIFLGLNLDKLPKIDFTKYKKLKHLEVVQSLVNEGYTVAEISDIIDLSRQSINNYIRDGLVIVPENSPIGKKMYTPHIEKAQELIYKQVPLRKIARDLKIPYSTLSPWTRNGTLDVSKYNAKHKKDVRDPELVEKIQELINKFHTVLQIADILGIGRSKIYYYRDNDYVEIPEGSPIARKVDDKKIEKV